MHKHSKAEFPPSRSNLSDNSGIHLAIILLNKLLAEVYATKPFATKACSKGYKTKFFKYFEFIALFEKAVDNTIDKQLIKKLMTFDLLIIDDFGLTSIPSAVEGILLDFIDNYSICGSLLITSQFSYDLWHTKFQDPTIADAILDRIIHNSYTLEIDGDSMRKTVMLDTTTTL